MKTNINKFLNDIVDDISDGIYILDKELKIIFMNKNAKKIMGVNPNDNSMMNIKWTDFLKKTLGTYTGFSYTPFKTDKESTYYEVKLETSNGKCTYLKQQNKQIFDSKGNLLGVAAMLRDVAEVASLTPVLPDTDSFYNIIGKNYKMLKMYDSIKQVAHTNATVLILGETGTGKELVAEAIHTLSEKKDGPLIKINCSALPETILESELFGHVKGAFTGAIKDKIGKFELANRGTIFLDEIGELDPKLQVKLLRVLERKEIEKVGDIKTTKINVRIITATNKDLRKAVKEGKFREDLYFRLKVFPINTPPLREHLDDIELLCRYFIDEFSKAHKKKTALSQEVIDLFKRYSWPGNVRELQHTIEYAYIKTKKNIITYEDLPDELFERGDTVVIHQDYVPPKNLYLNKNVIKETLKAVGWNKTQAAKKLNISRTTIWRLIKKFNIKKPILLTYNKPLNTYLIPKK